VVMKKDEKSTFLNIYSSAWNLKLIDGSEVV
jgi:hypothetical protein